MNCRNLVVFAVIGNVQFTRIEICLIFYVWVLKLTYLAIFSLGLALASVALAIYFEVVKDAIALACLKI